ncbi:MAG: nitroreductase [Pseudomonadota bacterium]
MPDANPQAVEFLRTRRSRPAKLIGPPVPNKTEIEALLAMAARSPDHGKLEPWRFIVYTHEACLRLAKAVEARAIEDGQDAERAALMGRTYERAHLIVAVIASPKDSRAIPQIEQTLSAGGVCLALVNAALASGWGASWISGWASHDRKFVTEPMGLSETEFVAGMVHIGTEAEAPPERPRPDIDAITTWVNA